MKVPSGARCCEACGVSLDVVVIDVDLDGDGPFWPVPVEPETAARSRMAVLAGALVVVGVIALVVFASSRAEAPEAADDSAPAPIDDTSDDDLTTVEAMPQLAIDDPLNWQAGSELGGVSPVGFVEFDGSLFLFAHFGVDPFGARRDGLLAWRSADGLVWEPLGPVIAAAGDVTSVVKRPSGFLAVGRDSEGRPTLWTSVDGRAWFSQNLPESGEGGDSLLPDAVAVVNDLVVVAATPVDNRSSRLLREAVAAQAGLPYQDLRRLSWRIRPFVVTVEGPFGIPFVEFTAEDLGLSDAYVDALTSPVRATAGTTVWASIDGADWTVSTLPGVSFIGLTVTGDELLVMSGHGEDGSRTWTSRDGVDWQEGPVLLISAPARWGPLIVGARNDGSGDITVSRDGIDWQRIAISDLLVDELQWQTIRLAANDRGIAAVVEGWGQPDFNPNQSASISKDGYTLSTSRGTLVLSHADTELLTIATYQSTQPSIAVDLAERTVAFLDESTNEPYVTFTIDELERLENHTEGEFFPEFQQRVLFSKEGASWSINDPAHFAGEGSRVVALAVTDDTLVIATTPTQSGEPSSQPQPLLQIFTATLPR